MRNMLLSSHCIHFTGRLQDESESIFNYSLTNSGNFSFLSTQLHEPLFLEDLVGNLTALFSVANASHNESDIQEFEDLCKNYTQCLLAIARADNIEAGQLVMDQIHADEYNKAYAGKSINYILNTPD